MPRLIDDLRASDRIAIPWFIRRDREREWSAGVAAAHRALGDRGIPVLLIDNVAEYYFAASDQEFWSLDKDFPNLAPPFPLFWCEHKIPRVIRSRECGDTETGVRGGRIGVLASALDPASDVRMDGAPPAGTRWILYFTLFIDYRSNGAIEGPPGPVFLCVDAGGRALDCPWTQSYADERAPVEVIKSYMTWLHPALLAMSFLHCRNVALEEHRVDRPLAKKYRARHGVEPTPYKTLVIEPLKQILRREGGHGAGNGLAKAMHICRGHFADYREGRGLFGKYKVQVFIPATVRGTRGKSAPEREIEVKV